MLASALQDVSRQFEALVPSAHVTGSGGDRYLKVERNLCARKSGNQAGRGTVQTTIKDESPH